MVDDFCQSRPPRRRPAPDASLSESEVLTLAIFARWSRFNSERNFYRYATGHLTDAFPTLPERSQFDRLLRSCTELIEAFSLHLASLLTDARKCPYQALDSSAMLSETASVGGMDGWPEMPTHRLVQQHRLVPTGFSLLTATDPTRIITGFCFSAASTADQSMAESFFALRAHPNPRLPSVGSIGWGPT
jgi:hypothetical protein